MKIGIYLSTSPLTPQAGGAHTFINSIFEEVKKYSGKHTFYFFHVGTTNIDKIGNIAVIPLSLYQTKQNHSFFKKVLHKTRIKRIITKQENILNKAAFDNNIELMWFMNPANKQVDVPFLYTVWDLQHRRQSYFPEVSVTGNDFYTREKQYGSLIPRATYVITGNDTGKKEIINFYNMPEERIKTLPFPTPKFALNPQETDISILEKYKIKIPYLFYPAQFWPHKNHIVILHALKILKEKNKLNFSVVFTGTDKGNLEYIKEQAQKLNINNHIHFLGFVSIEELVTLYQNAFALTFASFFGPDNIPPLEAFGLQCPVIASNVPGSQKQMGNAALFFNPKCPVELSEKITQLYNDENLRKKLIAKGLKQALSWTAKDYLSEIIKIIDEFEPIRRCWSNNKKYIHP